MREGLDFMAPVDDVGIFTKRAANGRLRGLPVFTDGTQAVRSVSLSQVQTVVIPFEMTTQFQPGRKLIPYFSINTVLPIHYSFISIRTILMTTAPF